MLKLRANADRTILLDAGRVTEQGTLEELLATSAQMRRSWQMSRVMIRRDFEMMIVSCAGRFEQVPG